MTSSFPPVPPTNGRYVLRRLETSPKAAKFIAATAANGGATMDLKTGKLYGEKGPEEAESVGAEPSVHTGEPIATHIYAGKNNISATQFAHEHIRLGNLADPDVAMGSWANNGNVEIDASRVFTNPKAASEKVVERDQDASFDFRNFENVPYEEHAKRIGSKKPQNKKAKNEMVITSDADLNTPKFRDE